MQRLSFSVLDSLLSPKLLNEHQLARMNVVEFLCLFCTYCGESIGSNYAPSTLASKLLDLLDKDEQGWDPKKAFDLQVVGIQYDTKYWMVLKICSISNIGHQMFFSHEWSSQIVLSHAPSSPYYRFVSTLNGSITFR